MKVLVTGASGLLASNTVLELLDHGFEVRALTRDQQKSILRNEKVEFVCGSLFDESDLDSALENCDAVVHVAALTNQSLLKYSDYSTLNVQATEVLLKASIDRGIKAFVYVSSANVFGYGDEEYPGNEDRPMSPPFDESLYARSKYECQEKVLQISLEGHQTRIMVVNPTFMIGPYDSNFSSGRIFKQSWGTGLVFYPPGGKNFVHVRDVARGIVQVIKRGKNGEAYILSNVNMSYRTFFEKLRSKSNRRQILVQVPEVIMKLVGLVGDFLRYVNVKTDLSGANMRILCRKNYYSSKKAEKSIGFRVGAIDKAIDEAIEWYRHTKQFKNNF